MPDVNTMKTHDVMHMDIGDVIDLRYINNHKLQYNGSWYELSIKKCVICGEAGITVNNVYVHSIMIGHDKQPIVTHYCDPADAKTYVATNPLQDYIKNKILDPFKNFFN